jgi:hypothetical protein
LAAGAAFASAGAAAGFTPGLAANAVTTAAPMASAIKPAASLKRTFDHPPSRPRCAAGAQGFFGL